MLRKEPHGDVEHRSRIQDRPPDQRGHTLRLLSFFWRRIAPLKFDRNFRARCYGTSNAPISMSPCRMTPSKSTVGALSRLPLLIAGESVRRWKFPAASSKKLRSTDNFPSAPVGFWRNYG